MSVAVALLLLGAAPVTFTGQVFGPDVSIAGNMDAGTLVVAGQARIGGNLVVSGTVDAGVGYYTPSAANNSINTAGGVIAAGLVQAGTTVTAGTNLVAAQTATVRGQMSNDSSGANCTGSAGAVCVNDVDGFAVANGSNTVGATISGAGTITSNQASGQVALATASGTLVEYNSPTNSVYTQEDGTGNLRIAAGGNGGGKYVIVQAGAVSVGGLSLSVDGTNTGVTLTTCGATKKGWLQLDALGGTGGKATKLCLCVLEADGTTYRWLNLANATVAASRTGTTTTCPDTN